MNDNSAQGEIKYVSVSRVTDATLMISIPSSTTKKAYADEVSDTNLFFLANLWSLRIPI